MSNDKKRAAERAIATAKKVTPPMVSYLEGLLISCGFSDRVQRNAYLTGECEREIKFLDALTMDEGRKLISVLEAKRDRARYNPGDEDDEPEEIDQDWNRR